MNANDPFPAQIPTVWRVALGFGVVFVVAQPFLYWPAYAGDAQIHLVFGENAARGAFYQFNPGEVSSGVTSSGYMLWLALLFRVCPPEVVPVAAKLSGILAYWAASGMLFGLARELLRSPGWAAAIALTCAGMPGSTFNSSVGMETSFFLALLVGWLWWAVRHDWFSGENVGLGSELGLGILLGLGFWLRPEAALVGACAFGLRSIEALRKGSLARVAPGALLSATAALTVALGALAFHHEFTGEWLPTSGRARIFIAQIVSPSFGPFLFDSAFPIRLIAYAPITLLFLIALPSISRGKNELELGDAARFSALLFGVGFVLYTFVTGAHHLARYISFLMPGFVLIAGGGARRLYANWSTIVPRSAKPHRSLAFAAIAVGISSLYVVEAGMRFNRAVLNEAEWHGSVSGLEGAARAPAMRKTNSDKWLQRLGYPTQRPIVIAMQEVQFRYEVDERFVIRSLDGRVDSALFEYVSPEQVDHVAYFRHRNVDYLFDAPHYVADPTQWSIAYLRTIEPNTSIVREGITFTRLDTATVWSVVEESENPAGSRKERRRRRRARDRLVPAPR